MQKTSNSEQQIAQELSEIKKKIADAHKTGVHIDGEAFDVRGRLYGIAADIAPHARDQDLKYMREWINPIAGEKSVDISAGTGFLTIPLTQWTGNTTYAVDPSAIQLEVLSKKISGLPIKLVPLPPSDQKLFDVLDADAGKIDIVTSFGGLHHIVDKNDTDMQQLTFQNVSKLLKPGGRFIGADVGAGTKLAHHFESSVKNHCLTSHEEKWLSPERLSRELLEGTELEFIRAEIVPITWVFQTEDEMVLFMKALHAYDMTHEAVLRDLQSLLGYEKHQDGTYHLNWPMLLFELRKKNNLSTNILTSIPQKNIADHPSFDNHAHVYELNDPSVGLRGYIALHRIRNSSAIGGTRIFPYARHADALTDVLRLSRAMSYKCALADIPMGGGKAVLIADPRIAKTPAFLTAYARAISELKGKFYTGEDVGLSLADVQHMHEYSPYFLGRSDAAGDPSEFAAYSTFVAMQAALRITRGSDSLNGLHIAIKGVGKVGTELARLCTEAGAKLTVADNNPNAIQRLKKIVPHLEVVPSEVIHTIIADVYAPCALGNEFTDTSINTIGAKIICGAANNQLEKPAYGIQLHNRNILYIPDFIANAGGLINVADELNPESYSRNRVLERIKDIDRVTTALILDSQKTNTPTSVLADTYARNVIDI